MTPALFIDEADDLDIATYEKATAHTNLGDGHVWSLPGTSHDFRELCSVLNTERDDLTTLLRLSDQVNKESAPRPEWSANLGI